MGVEEGELESSFLSSFLHSSVFLLQAELTIYIQLVQISPIDRPGTRLPNYQNEEEVWWYEGFKPFVGSFPFEIFDLISSFVGLRTLASMAGTSFENFEVFAPRLYTNIDVSERSRSLRSLFDSKVSSLFLSSLLDLSPFFAFFFQSLRYSFVIYRVLHHPSDFPQSSPSATSASSPSPLPHFVLTSVPLRPPSAGRVWASLKSLWRSKNSF